MRSAPMRAHGAEVADVACRRHVRTLRSRDTGPVEGVVGPRVDVGGLCDLRAVATRRSVPSAGDRACVVGFAERMGAPRRAGRPGSRGRRTSRSRRGGPGDEAARRRTVDDDGTPERDHARAPPLTAPRHRAGRRRDVAGSHGAGDECDGPADGLVFRHVGGRNRGDRRRVWRRFRSSADRDRVVPVHRHRGVDPVVGFAPCRDA